MQSVGYSNGRCRECPVGAALYGLFGYEWPKGYGKLFLKMKAVCSICVLLVNENDGNILQSV